MAGPSYLLSGANGQTNFETLAKGVCWTQQYQKVYNEGEANDTRAKPYVVAAVIIVAIPIILGYYVVAAVTALVIVVIGTRSKDFADFCRNADELRAEEKIMTYIAANVRLYLDRKKKEVDGLTPSDASSDEAEKWYTDQDNVAFYKQCVSIVDWHCLPCNKDLTGKVKHANYFGEVVTVAHSIYLQCRETYNEVHSHDAPGPQS